MQNQKDHYFIDSTDPPEHPDQQALALWSARPVTECFSVSISYSNAPQDSKCEPATSPDARPCTAIALLLPRLRIAPAPPLY